MAQSAFSEDTDICLHRFEDTEQFKGAVIPPTYNNTLFVFDSFKELAGGDQQQENHFVYSRGKNPTVELVEKKLAALERGERCVCFSSGMAAVSAAILNSVKSGDHIVVVGHIYQTTLDLMNYLQRFHVSHTVVYSNDIEVVRQHIMPKTTLIFLESPTDLHFRIVDLIALAQLAKSEGVRTVIDNTWATPLFQKPLTFGIDIVVHSASKYLGGHSDVMGGAVISSNSIMKKLFSEEYLYMGGVLNPDEASKLLRGLRTLPIRMKVHQEHALKVAQFLESNEKVTKVHYPGLQSHPDYEMARKQMSGYSGLFSFEIASSSFKDVAKVIDGLKVFQIGVSWGSFESSAWSPNYGSNEEQLKSEHIHPGIIRLAVGQGNTDELIEDLEQALRNM